MLFAWIFLKEKVSSKLGLALLVAYSGIALFFVADLGFADEKPCFRQCIGIYC